MTKIFLAGILFSTAAFAAGTVWDGAYSEAQAERGRATFERKCEQCHGPDGRKMAAQGFSLEGPEFVDLWREDNLSVLVAYIRANMPKGGEQPIPGTGPLSLDDPGKLEALAFVLKTNGFPAGPADLTIASAANIALVGKDGPKPLPNLTNVIVSGCLGVDAKGVWSLSKVTSPKRTMEALQVTPDELKAMASAAPGAGSLRVNNFDVINFNADAAKGKQLVVKGILYTSPTNPRLNATSAEPTGASCNP